MAILIEQGVDFFLGAHWLRRG